MKLALALLALGLVGIGAGRHWRWSVVVQTLARVGVSCHGHLLAPVVLALLVALLAVSLSALLALCWVAWSTHCSVLLRLARVRPQGALVQGVAAL